MISLDARRFLIRQRNNRLCAGISQRLKALEDLPARRPARLRMREETDAVRPTNPLRPRLCSNEGFHNLQLYQHGGLK